jgi:hypothetical protein
VESLNRIKRLFKKSPRYILNRVLTELWLECDRILYSNPDKKYDLNKFLKLSNSDDIDNLWEQHKARPFALNFPSEYDILAFTQNNLYSKHKILEKAEEVLTGKINLLGTGDFDFGNKINWSKDYKSGVIWKNCYYRDLNYVNFNDKSDVKIPWEISRMQWLVPVGQAYIFTKNEKYALFVKNLLNDWIKENPYAHSVNWTCTMEVALRIITFQWFFYVFAESIEWSDQEFRFLFLKSLYFHAFFTERNLEKSDINGNHYTADGAGLVFAGLFFNGYKRDSNFLNKGLEIINNEIELQVFDDGVDYEASIPYHRLVTELFFFPALYLINSGHKLKDVYINKLVKMAFFIKYYSRNNGTVPLIGDADDARTIPMGFQSINDHDYLASLIGLVFNEAQLISGNESTFDEIFWILGYKALEKLPIYEKGHYTKAFPDGGFYVMGNIDSHIFIDCGPIGLSGRGGHGHNDILSFEAFIQGEQLITDCGAYLYTADYLERNAFRSTSYHNTPMIDKEEINRFISPKNLWNFQYDAKPVLLQWETKNFLDIFKGSHSGYLRLKDPLQPIRTIIFKRDTSELLINDIISGKGIHFASIPIHLYTGVEIHDVTTYSLTLVSGNKQFKLFWRGEGWRLIQEKSRISKSYGLTEPIKKISWVSENVINNPLTLFLTTNESKSYAYSLMDSMLLEA